MLNLPALGTSLLVITVNSLAARAGTAADLDRAVIAPFAAAAIPGARDGKRHAQRLATQLRRIFAHVLLAVAARMLANAFV